MFRQRLLCHPKTCDLTSAQVTSCDPVDGCMNGLATTATTATIASLSVAACATDNDYQAAFCASDTCISETCETTNPCSSMCSSVCNETSNSCEFDLSGTPCTGDGCFAMAWKFAMDQGIVSAQATRALAAANATTIFVVKLTITVSTDIENVYRRWKSVHRRQVQRRRIVCAHCASNWHIVQRRLLLQRRGHVRHKRKLYLRGRPLFCGRHVRQPV